MDIYQILTNIWHSSIFWILVAIIGILDLIWLYFWFFEKEYLKEKLSKNTWFKVSSYLLAVISAIILLIPTLYLLSLLFSKFSGSRGRVRQRRTKRKKRYRY